MYIHNATIVTWESPNRILPGHSVLIRDGKIAAIAPDGKLASLPDDGPGLDAKGRLLLPGGICAHTHFYGAFARGMSIPGTPPTDFPQILKKLWWPLDRALTEADIRYSALVCLVDAIRHGTTTFFDHHASPNAIEGSLDVIAAAVEEAGLRAVLCYEVTDRDGPEKMKAGMAENLRFIERSRRTPNPLLAATFGLHASLTLSDDTLDACRAAAPEGIGFHVHLAESQADQDDSLEKSGLRVGRRLYQHGILGPHTIAAHCVHIDEVEAGLLAETGTWVTHQPRSNMNNAVGAAPVEELLETGVNVCLGNDGFSNTMWDEWKAAYLLHKVWNGDPRRMPGNAVEQMAIYNNAALAGQFFPGAPIGQISPGAAADLILVDYHPTTPLTPGNLPWHILFGFNESMITHTIVNGKILMQERQLLTLDEEAICARARELAQAVWERR
jgi:putative selenium metabolism protein SsnA